VTVGVCAASLAVQWPDFSRSFRKNWDHITWSQHPGMRSQASRTGSSSQRRPEELQTHNRSTKVVPLFSLNCCRKYHLRNRKNVGADFSGLDLLWVPVQAEASPSRGRSTRPASPPEGQRVTKLLEGPGLRSRELGTFSTQMLYTVLDTVEGPQLS
jgi:hypothetical protein